MSRLDYITIAIVAACILAIIFLINKMTSLFGDQPKPAVETTAEKVEEDTDSTYNYDSQEEEAEPDASSGSRTDEESAPAPSTPSTPAPTRPAPKETVNPTTSRRAISDPSSGKYMVIAGTFSQKSSAQGHLKKLRSMGFNNATIEPFDRGKFDVVLVDRFDNMAAAERLVKDLKAEGVSSYVKTKEGN